MRATFKENFFVGGLSWFTCTCAGTEAVALSTDLLARAFDVLARIIHTLSLDWITDPSTSAENFDTRIWFTKTFMTEEALLTGDFAAWIVFASPFRALFCFLAFDAGTAFYALSFFAEFFRWALFVCTGICFTFALNTALFVCAAFGITVIFHTNTTLTGELTWTLKIFARIDTLAFLADATFRALNPITRIVFTIS